MEGIKIKIKLMYRLVFKTKKHIKKKKVFKQL